jgi:hypothetical protein
MPGFVIEYNRRSRDYKVTTFDGERGHRDAFDLRLQLEADREDSDVEIVSLTSDSLETVKKTHSRYFSGRQLLSA